MIWIWGKEGYIPWPETWLARWICLRGDLREGNRMFDFFLLGILLFWNLLGVIGCPPLDFSPVCNNITFFLFYVESHTIFFLSFLVYFNLGLLFNTIACFYYYFILYILLYPPMTGYHPPPPPPPPPPSPVLSLLLSSTLDKYTKILLLRIIHFVRSKFLSYYGPVIHWYLKIIVNLGSYSPFPPSI